MLSAEPVGYRGDGGRGQEFPVTSQFEVLEAGPQPELIVRERCSCSA